MEDSFWPRLLKGKSDKVSYIFVGSFTGECARYQGLYGLVFITKQDLKDKLWESVITNLGQN